MNPALRPAPRSMLFVPGDSEKKLARCEAVAADALILDLEDSVEPQRKAQARGLVAEFLRGRSRPRAVWVRINAPGTAECAQDMAAVLPAGSDGLIVPKARAQDIVELGQWLDTHEQRFNVSPGTTRLLPIATETPAAVLRLDEYQHRAGRLAALTWGAEDLSVALGALDNVDEDGQWLPPYQLARSLCLIAAAAAGIAAIDTVFTDLHDHAGLARSAAAARRDGFAGKLAIHPDQVEIIHRAFLPDPDEVAQATRIIAAFEAAGSGVVAFEGRMLDQPHLVRARRTVALQEIARARDRSSIMDG
ncbi:MAG: CoA ester lyase [Steroidobacteraceae bacterium]